MDLARKERDDKLFRQPIEVVRAERGDLVVVRGINGLLIGIVTKVDIRGMVIRFKPFGAGRVVTVNYAAERAIVSHREIDIAKAAAIIRDLQQPLEFFYDASVMLDPARIKMGKP